MMKSFRLRIVAWYTLIALLILIFFRIASVEIIHESLFRELDQSLEGEMRWIKNMLASYRSRDLPDEEIREEILIRSRLSPRKEFIEIYDREGQEYLRSPNLEESDTLRNLSPLAAHDSVTISRFRSHNLRLIASRDQDFEIYIGYPLTDVDAAVEEIIASSVFLLPVAILLLIGGGYFLATRFVKPLRDLSVYAERLVDQPLDRELPEVSVRVRDEAGLLIEQINRMVHRMRSSMRHVLSFATLASHELRTPLTVVRNELEEVLHEEASRESLQSTLASTYDEVLRLSRVVDDLMSIGTMQAGTFRVERSKTDLTMFLTEFCEEASLICKAKRITVEPRLDPGCVVDLDPEWFRHVLFNLLDNAIRHTPEGGSIAITTRRADDVIILEFSDSGGGIDVSEIRYVFDPFRRAERDGARGEGAGLGLALARWITEAHGGSIHVSRTDSQGTTFSIILPVSKSH